MVLWFHHANLTRRPTSHFDREVEEEEEEEEEEEQQEEEEGVEEEEDEKEAREDGEIDNVQLDDLINSDDE